jgi:hypothetical protein
MIRTKMYLDLNQITRTRKRYSIWGLWGFSKGITFPWIRYHRNGAKYYGIMLDIEYAMSVYEFMNKIYPPGGYIIEVDLKIE